MSAASTTPVATPSSSSMPICRIRPSASGHGPRMGGGLRRRADATAQPAQEMLAQEGDGTAFYRAMGRLGTIDIRRTSAISGCSPGAPSSPSPFPERSRFMKACSRGLASRAGDRVRSRRPFRRRNQVELLAPVELRAGRDHVVFGGAAEDRELRRPRHGAVGFAYGLYVVVKTLVIGTASLAIRRWSR